jgi:hypothetical protein
MLNQGLQSSGRDAREQRMQGDQVQPLRTLTLGARVGEALG